MSEIINDGINVINDMTKNDFHKKVVHNICQTSEFSWLATFLAENTPEEYKIKVRFDLNQIGIPDYCLKTDADINDIVTAIISRSIQLR